MTYQSKKKTARKTEPDAAAGEEWLLKSGSGVKRTKWPDLLRGGTGVRRRDAPHRQDLPALVDSSAGLLDKDDMGEHVLPWLKF